MPESLAGEWERYQRLKLDSLQGLAGGHAFTDWWNRFNEDHPDWFALQPDGTRSGYPAPRTVKLCLSNPGVWDQWLADVEKAIRENPELKMFMAGENDSFLSGLCVCENCRDWDHPEAQTYTYSWEGHSQEYVAMTDRYVTFWNHLARKLKERFPDRDDLYVQGLAYGVSTPPPIEAVPDDNVIISYVGLFPTINETGRREQKAKFSGWSRVAPHIFYRPNLWYFGGGTWALPEIVIRNVMEDFRFIAENNCMGLFVDTTREHWSTQAPQYYLMAQLTWDPLQDGQAVLEDYYRRGFGNAADQINSYWNLMEEATGKVFASPDFAPGGKHRYKLVEILHEVYSEDLLGRAAELIRQAAEKVADGPGKYRERVDFIRSGFVLTRLMIQNIPLMKRVRESNGKDKEAVGRVIENWQAIDNLYYHHAGPISFNHKNLLWKMGGGGYMGTMKDYFGPVSKKLLRD
jgi:hypothetical protein